MLFYHIYIICFIINHNNPYPLSRSGSHCPTYKPRCQRVRLVVRLHRYTNLNNPSTVIATPERSTAVILKITIAKRQTGVVLSNWVQNTGLTTVSCFHKSIIITEYHSFWEITLWIIPVRALTLPQRQYYCIVVIELQMQSYLSIKIPGEGDHKVSAQ